MDHFFPTQLTCAKKTWFTSAKAFPFLILEFAMKVLKAKEAVLWALLPSEGDPLQDAPGKSLYLCGWKEIIHPAVFP